MTPAANYHVATLTVDGVARTAASSYTFTNVTANHTIAVTFAINTYTLTITTVGSGTVAKNPNLTTFNYGTAVKLTATPAAGWAFSAWSGDKVATTDTTTVLMTANRSVTATFVDAQAPVVTVTSPNGGEAWIVGAAKSITWTATDNVAVTSVDLALSTNGGSSWTNIATGLANTGSYAWTVPNSPTTTARVRVIARDARANAGRDSSNAISVKRCSNSISSGARDSCATDWTVPMISWMAL